eukprot:6214830-Pleurochrysis_carterae.AAC.2
MEHVQIHPTGFVDPSDPDASTKVLCGEMIRGVGGILLTPDGTRFVNELSPRDKVVAAQLATGAAAFPILLNAAAAAEAGKHVELYTRKGLLKRLNGVSELAEFILNPPRFVETNGSATATALAQVLSTTLAQYNAAAAAGADEFGKRYFYNAPFDPDGAFVAGWIVPVLHYTMGGITMDSNGAVLRADGTRILGLHAAGEVTGGVHGHNRLGGNSLLECVVFGSIVGKALAEEVKQARALAAEAAMAGGTGRPAVAASTASTVGAAATQATQGSAGDGTATAGGWRQVDRAELSLHTTADDCWVSLYGKVYDFSSFLEEHPAGPESILKLGGTDGTAMYETVHNLGMLDDFTTELVGELVG